MVRIQSDESWTAVKNVMRSIISSSKGDFTYTNTSDNMSYEVSEDYARIIAVQDVAKQALVKDYEANKPQVEAPAPTQETKEDPNAGIYPTQNVETPIGSEVVPGIAEVSEGSSDVSIPVLEEAQNDNDDIVGEKVEEEAKEEAQTVEETPVESETPAVEEAAVETPAVETPVAEEVQETAAEETPVEESAQEKVEEPVQEEAPTVSAPSSSASTPRDILVQDIIAAVDKYLASTSKSDDIKARLAKMQEELNLMNQEL